MNVQVVTSASKKAECLSGAPAAIFVLTGAEIQRQGFATLPEVLRTVPGLYVSQTNAHTWQISARGFSDVNNNKMLVLVDGRSAYSMEPGTVYWDTLDISPENIDRVEVIRGPGGALWGDNAVNGVTNIVLKSADQMQGALLSTGASPETGYTATVRYGGQFGSQVSYSFFGRAAYWEPFHNPDGSPGPDHFAFPQGGLRVDWVASSADAISLEGSGYDGRSGQTGLQNNIPNSYLVKGGEVAFRWKHTLSKRASTDALAYCDWYARVGVPAEKRNRCDIEFQNSLQFNPRRSLIWGSSFFSTGDDLTSDPAPYIPERRRSNVVSAFAQCEYAILPDRLRAVGGVKLEHNDYTGFEYQPQGRLVWTPGKAMSMWASISRSVRTPTRNNSDLNFLVPVGFSGGNPVFEHLIGEPALQAERIFAYEAGYRWRTHSSVSLDLAAYYNDYKGLIVPSAPVIQVFPDRTVLESHFINGPNAQAGTQHGGLLLQRDSNWVRCRAATAIRACLLPFRCGSRMAPRTTVDVQCLGSQPPVRPAFGNPGYGRWKSSGRNTTLGGDPVTLALSRGS